MTSIQKEIIDLIEKAIDYAYPLRWADEKTSLCDFDGHEFTIDVFKIPLSNQIKFLSRIRPIRDKIRALIGSRGIFVFHSPEATNKYYSHLFPVTRGVHLHDNATIKIPFPDSGGTECKPEINGPAYLKIGEAA